MGGQAGSVANRQTDIRTNEKLFLSVGLIMQEHVEVRNTKLGSTVAALKKNGQDRKTVD